MPAEALKSLGVPIEVISGENDPARRFAVEPLLRLRPDLTAHVVANADHLSCVIKPQFEADLEAALTRQLDLTASPTKPAPADKHPS